ncbi:hypothetical protein MTO96_020319 [Rhipicephalus appendiculatus]
MAYWPEHYQRELSLEKKAPVSHPFRDGRTTLATHGRTISGTSGAFYEKRRDTLATCLVATAVALVMIMVILMLILVFINVGDEDRPFTFEETTSDSPGMVHPLLVEGASGAELLTGKLALDGVLLCTLRARLSIRAYVYPGDGVCAITLFNSLFVTRGSTLTPPYNSDLTHFLDTASHHSKTEYGIGIDHKNETFMSSLVAEQTTKTSLDEMWSHRVYHYGQVNTPPIITGFDTFQYITQSAKGLQMISQLMKDKAYSGTSYTVLHYPLTYESMAADVAKALTAYPVDLLVAFGYIAYGDYGKKDCRMVPPVLHSTELLEPFLLNDAYPVRLVRVISALADLKKEWANTTALAVSLGMGGRWYLPAYPDKNVSVPGNYSLGHQCKTATRGDAPPRDQIASIEEACEDSNYNQTFSYDSTFEAMFAYDKSDHFLFTYDSADSFRIKLCETKENFTDLLYNLVADDIQYDDIDNSCGYGGYSRLHILNRLAAFLGKNYTSHGRESDCKSVT